LRGLSPPPTREKKPGEGRVQQDGQQPIHGVVETYQEVFADVITSRNLQGLPTTARLISAEIQKKTGDLVHASTVKRGHTIEYIHRGEQKYTEIRL
jgi:hypothetical protein